MRDNEDLAVQYLREIRNELRGGISTDPQGRPSTLAGYRLLDRSSLVVRETSDLEMANDDGSISLTPGDETAIVAHEPASDQGCFVLAVGASDEQNVSYGLRVDDNYWFGGRTESPLGSINDPFSFVDALGAMIPAVSNVEYVAVYDPTASGDIELAARLFVEEI